jgi:GDP-4-dehydro-6-deoxy-D-mannose reductase
LQALITGAGGFAGRYLTRYLAQHTSLQLHGCVIEPVSVHQDLVDETAITLHQIDLCEPAQVLELLDRVRPDYVFHLAALAAVGRSWQAPWETIANNVHAQLNIFQTIIALGTKPRVLVVGSSEEYGLVSEAENPINEQTPLRPDNPYSVSKITQDMMGLQYFYSHQIPVVRVRPFNHIGPGQRLQFVVPDFASQIAKAEAGLIDPVMYVGNLDARRDFTDVRDVVRAYHLVTTQGVPGEVYNIGTGAAHSIRELLDVLLSLSTIPIDVKPDPDRMRPSDVQLSVCDAGKLRRDIGWQPEITFEQSLADVLDDWRRRVAAGDTD